MPAVVATRQTFAPQPDNEFDDNLYSNYENTNNTNIINDAVTRIATATAGKRPPTGSVRLATGSMTQQQQQQSMPMSGSSTGSNSVVRPMTAVKSAGFSAVTGGALTNTIGLTGTTVPPLIKLTDTVNGIAVQLERDVHSMLEQSALSSSQHQYVTALDQAKKSGLAERSLVKHRDKHQIEQNIDLTYAVLINLGIQYTNNGTAHNDQALYDEALNVYQTILNKKQFPVARVRVNMGHIYYTQKKYVLAIKCYRIAIDTLNGNTQLRKHLMRNIGNSFVRLRQFNDAVHSYDTITDDVVSAFNLCLCYYTLGDIEKLKHQFGVLINCSEFVSIARDVAGGLSEPADTGADGSDDHSDGHIDELKVNRLKRQKQLYHYIYVVAKLIAPLIVRGDLDKGYNWCIEQLQAVDAKQSGINAMTGENQQDDVSDTPSMFGRVAQELNISKGIQYLRTNQTSEALAVFKSIDKTVDTLVYAHAAINLAYIAHLNGDSAAALQYADTAAKYDRYNANALVNKANCQCQDGQLDDARELYLESIGVESNCYAAIYNLGLCNKRGGLYDDALQAFKKLYRANPDDAYVVYQIGVVYELMGEYERAIEWLNILHNTVVNDAELLHRLGTLHYKLSQAGGGGVHAQHAYHYHIESYQLNPTNVDIISWLGVYAVLHKLYDDAIVYFTVASRIESYEPKWMLMVASCYRRVGQVDDAVELYTRLLSTEYSDDGKNDSKNIECLKYLMAIYGEMGDRDRVDMYAAQLAKYDDIMASSEPQQQSAPQTQQQQQPTSSGGGQGGYAGGRPMSAMRTVVPESMRAQMYGTANIYDARSEITQKVHGQTVNGGLGVADHDNEWNTLETDELLV